MRVRGDFSVREVNVKNEPQRETEVMQLIILIKKKLW